MCLVTLDILNLPSDFSLLGQYTNNQRCTRQSDLDSYEEEKAKSVEYLRKMCVWGNIPNVLLKLATKARTISRRKGPCKACTYATSLNTFLAICDTKISWQFSSSKRQNPTNLIPINHPLQNSMQVRSQSRLENRTCSTNASHNTDIGTKV
jgi:hypothetical protein